jgi:hypothetical protein
MNSLYQEMMGNQAQNPQNDNVQSLRQMANAVRNSRNPQMMLMELAQSNPQMKQAIEYIGQNGGNAKEAFYALAKQKGVNPDTILNMFR